MMRFYYILLLLFVAPREILSGKYHSNNEILGFLDRFSETSSLKTLVFSIGKSVSGFPLKVLRINQPGNRIGVPSIKLIANIHGNEVVGREVLLHFIQFLDKNYETNKQVKCLVDNVRIYILPTMNPDGFSESIQGQCEGVTGRHNKNDFDLNRNFPDYIYGNAYGVPQDEYRRMIQPEAAAIMKWMNRTRFVLSASLHGGAMVANYPFDNYGSPEELNNKYEALTPDHDVVYHLAKTYVHSHRRISKGVRCPWDEFGLVYFEDGLTNGAKWYTLKGGMQDYNYVAGCIELTLEISCCKYPQPKKLSMFKKENIQPLLKFGLQALRGIKGRVFDSQTQKPIAEAILHIVGRKFTFRTSKKGEFWRILRPGAYNLKVEAVGYESVTERITAEEYSEDECPQIPMISISLKPKQ